MTIRVLTGITTTGTPHLGNYVGAIRPSVQASTQPDVDAFYFLADYHALIKCEDPERVARSRLEIAATWLAAGLDPDVVTFYRQSDIPEIPELCWMLTCVTAKGLMNRAHAYKAAVDQNTEKQVESDDGINMGLFSYPILMAADILMFNANKVPVGRDQIQHLEMARDIAQRFNHMYGRGTDLFALPEVLIDDNVATVPGLDGRKMSKSYDNTIPLFEGGAKALSGAIKRIVTDSRAPGEPKDAEGSHILTLYRAFADEQQTASFKHALEQGLGWGDAKEQLYVLIDSELGPMRDRYQSLIAAPDRIEDILQAGAEKARQQSAPFIERLRASVGLRAAATTTVPGTKNSKKSPSAARFVSFREDSGVFRFRLLDASGAELFLSEPFKDPKATGLMIRNLQNGLQDSWIVQEADTVSLCVDGELVCRFPTDRLADVRAAINVA